MLFIDPKKLTEKENYKILSGTIIPRPVAFVTTTTENHLVNGAPFSFFNIVSSNPPLISLSIQRRDGKEKDTVSNILKTKDFVVHITSGEYLSKINNTAAFLDSNISEIEVNQFNLVESMVVKTPGIKESKVRFEVILEKHIEIRSEDIITADLIIGRIVGYHFNENIYDNSYINFIELNPIGRLAGSNYTKLGEIITLKRPK